MSQCGGDSTLNVSRMHKELLANSWWQWTCEILPVKVYWKEEYKLHAHVCQPMADLLVEFMNSIHIYGETDNEKFQLQLEIFRWVFSLHKIENVENSFNSAFNSLGLCFLLFTHTTRIWWVAIFFSSFSFRTVGMLEDCAASAFSCGCSLSKIDGAFGLLWVLSVGYAAGLTHWSPPRAVTIWIFFHTNATAYAHTFEEPEWTSWRFIFCLKQENSHLICPIEAHNRTATLIRGPQHGRNAKNQNRTNAAMVRTLSFFFFFFFQMERTVERKIKREHETTKWT